MKRVHPATAMVPIVAALGFALAGSALAYNDDSYFDYARVINVDRIVVPTTKPVTIQECSQEPVDEYHSGIHQRELPPVVSTTKGDENAIRGESRESDGYYTPADEEHCQTRTEYKPAPPTVAYDVVYSYHNQDYHDRIAHDPGSRVRVHVDNGYVEIAE